MCRVTVAMLGARMHYAVPRLLHEAGLLERFYTDSYIGNKPRLARMLSAIPQSIQPQEVKRWLGRADPVLPAQKVTSFERLGLWYAVARRIGRRDAAANVFEAAARHFSRCIGTRGLEGADVLWGFNGASLELFWEARAKGMRCILEQTLLPERLMRELLREETTRWPGWAPQPNVTTTVRATSAMEDREEREWELADRVVVGSDFVRSGLVQLGVPEMRISVVPYGVDSRHFQAVSPREERSKGCALRILFAGEVGLRKGAPDLLRALEILPCGATETRLAGAVALAEDKLKSWKDRVTFLGAIPRSEMQEIYRWADVFVLPSIVEGSATVTYEALMSGVPVITTANSGSIVRDGVDGFVVPVRDPESLAKAIIRYHEDRSLLARHRMATLEACRTAGLNRYRDDLVRVVMDVAGR